MYLADLTPLEQLNFHVGYSNDRVLRATLETQKTTYKEDFFDIMPVTLFFVAIITSLLRIWLALF